jgi:peptide chain release factor 1
MWCGVVWCDVVWCRAAARPELVGDATAEREAVVGALPGLEDEVLTHLLPRNRDDHRNAILEVRAGTGGDEASIFAADMFRMYERFCMNQGWK